MDLYLDRVSHNSGEQIKKLVPELAHREFSPGLLASLASHVNDEELPMLFFHQKAMYKM